MSKKFVVITSIFPPTEAVRVLAQQPEHQLLVVGDKKTPADWHHDNVQFISAAAQTASDYAICHQLPWNHYCRKMVGYIAAMDQGADVIIDTDDDNIPKDNWAFPDFAGTYEQVAAAGDINIYAFFTDKKIWPRGLPLKKILQSTSDLKKNLLPAAMTNVGVWQFLADDDPDVDALYRLTINQPVFFNDRAPLVLAPGTVAAFNSQNTAFRRELFPLLYLPAFVNFRYTDILRGLIAQPIMWQFGYRLGFGTATVRQLRNPHDYLKDFIDEIPMYETGEQVVPLVQEAIKHADNIPTALRLAYESLHRQAIVKQEELSLLSLWLENKHFLA